LIFETEKEYLLAPSAAGEAVVGAHTPLAIPRPPPNTKFLPIVAMHLFLTFQINKKAIVCH